ncbi:hypothetical protein F511_25570 [Dorcoceras hygrometricum]|uniref:Uncharacterized protein n=1 Tax=Dorcoceras hygrometricum TaxID=472368 RepID=A0A2Z7AR06_9LAMI|nr:hypothetical protein F511_25570 [Dorcoceras hygrometricum]
MKRSISVSHTLGKCSTQANKNSAFDSRSKLLFNGGRLLRSSISSLFFSKYHSCWSKLASARLRTTDSTLDVSIVNPAAVYNDESNQL